MRTNQFVSDLAGILLACTDLSQKRSVAIENIKRYERYLVSNSNAGKVIINESTLAIDDKKKKITQMDIPLAAEITDSQKQEYSRIHSADKPEWFKVLPKQERSWYLDHISTSMCNNFADAGWQKFAQVYKASTMQQSLEIKNARQNYFFVDDQLQYESTKIATLNPIEAPKEERQSLTNLNAEQLVTHLTKTAVANFRTHWGIPEGTAFDGQILIYSQVLLSPLPFDKADSKMIAAQRQAVESIAKSESDNNSQFKVLFGNDSVNFLRVFDKKQQNWQDTEAVIEYAEKLITLLKMTAVEPEKEIKKAKHIKFMEDIIAELRQLKATPGIYGRNIAAYKAALVGMLVEAAGGQASFNCKSGKDRTGLEELYRHAMHLYYEIYGKLPSYTDTGQERKNFTAIFIQLFNALKIHEAAGINSPGSFGIKDEAFMLCRDIAKSLGEDYVKSNTRSELNKTKEGYFEKQANAAQTDAKLTKILTRPKSTSHHSIETAAALDSNSTPQPAKDRKRSMTDAMAGKEIHDEQKKARDQGELTLESIVSKKQNLLIQGISNSLTKMGIKEPRITEIPPGSGLGTISYFPKDVVTDKFNKYITNKIEVSRNQDAQTKIRINPADPVSWQVSLDAMKKAGSTTIKISASKSDTAQAATEYARSIGLKVISPAPGLRPAHDIPG